MMVIRNVLAERSPPSGQEPCPEQAAPAITTSWDYQPPPTSISTWVPAASPSCEGAGLGTCSFSFLPRCQEPESQDGEERGPGTQDMCFGEQSSQDAFLLASLAPTLRPRTKAGRQLRASSRLAPPLQWEQYVYFHLTFRERRRQQDVLSFLALGIHSVEDHREVLFKTQIQDSVVSRKEF